MSCSGCLDKLFRGAKGVAKGVFGLDRAAGETERARDAICQACPLARPCSKRSNRMCWCGKISDALTTKTSTCGCFLPLKVKVAGEKCPIGKW